jgi:drug/metabolite transporter (DMT)-like permease
LLGRIGADRAGYAMVMFPVVALVLSALFEGLVLDWSILAGTALVIAGNAFTLTSGGSSTGVRLRLNLNRTLSPIRAGRVAPNNAARLKRISRT